MLPTCQKYGMGVIPWSPLAGGWLTGRYRKGAAGAGRPVAARSHAGPVRLRAAPRTSASSTSSRRCLRWPTRPACRSPTSPWRSCSSTRRVTSAIIGPRTMEQLTDVLAGADVRLTDEVLDRIDELVPPGTSITVADPWQPAANATSATAAAAADQRWVAFRCQAHGFRPNAVRD